MFDFFSGLSLKETFFTFYWGETALLLIIKFLNDGGYRLIIFSSVSYADFDFYRVKYKLSFDAISISLIPESLIDFSLINLTLLAINLLSFFALGLIKIWIL